MTWEDAVQYFLAGADAVQIGTGNFVTPDASVQVLEGIKSYMKEAGFETIQDFHGHF